MVCKIFDKKSAGGTTKSEIMSNQQLPDELYKPIIRSFEKHKVYCRPNVSSYLADMQLISKQRKGICYVL